MHAYSYQNKIHPARFYSLRAIYRQATPNFAYSFIKEVKFQSPRAGGLLVVGDLNHIVAN